MRVLLVEPDAVIATSYEEALLDGGHEVVGSATTGVEAVALVDRLRPDLLVAETRLRGKLSAVDLAETAFGRTAIRTLFVAGCPAYATGVRPECLAGMLEKPIRDDELLAAVGGAGRDPAAGR